ncbi:uncharacterized protein F4807DRAFT_440404 [Annulohypoxylon truncatum]|uniref:uncharacterized protein n=1 Tax=Annulohypoxylon truncatum TaxID=327061 RepID=UPI002007C744|nr:uncharacterized protein F4807DRAFT_440404 [Annulohypoxylon truncatum]KAI1206232.1 hypothetical protein F4807DRAFT_440404 [Annulohypoxylon truncatum]
MARLLPILATAFGLALAQSNYPNQSAPFNLVLQSSNDTLNGQKLAACHSGALIESLCLDTSVSTPEFQTFYFNGSAQAPTTPGFLPSGLITWTFTGGSPPLTTNTAMQFLYNAASNLAFPLIWPSTEGAQPVSFTDEGLLAVGANTNDAVSPPQPFENDIEYLADRWAICVTYWEGYGYTALQYVMGDKEPQNPSCQLVTIKRVYV